MPEFTVRADHIDVEEIMRQIRARVRDKRGVDYTEQEIRELASVKLDRFLDPRVVRSDLLGHFKRQHQPAPLFLEKEEWPALYAFDGELVYESSRGVVGTLLRLIRRALNPVMKLFINPGPVLHVLHLQGPINLKHKELFERISQRLQTRDELDALNFEMFNNLVVEATRLGIEVKNLRMQVESLSTRLDFDERRARALEGVVQYKPGAPIAPPPAAPDEGDEESPAAADATGEGRGSRRRRRRRGRRRGGVPGAEGVAAVAGQAGADRDSEGDEGGFDDNGDGDGDAPSSAADEGAPVAESAPESAPDVEPARVESIPEVESTSTPVPEVEPRREVPLVTERTSGEPPES
jgi:hypothetical protein